VSSANDAPPASERLAAVVRRGLQLDDAVPVSLREVGELANINYVYRVEVPGRSLYLKVVPERAKRLPVRLPRERVFSEAEGLRRFRALAGERVQIPEVLFVDEDEMALGMTDVGEGRHVLFELLPGGFELLGEQAEALGRALGTIHRGTRGSGSLRPAEEEAVIRRIVFDGLLAPGAMHVFPELWPEVLAEMQAFRECLIHGDLWSKNLLVRTGEPVAIVDFEGVCYGDPAFDLGTLTAVALVPALQRPALILEALAFVTRLLQSWSIACCSEPWYRAVLPRTFRAAATFLAARGFGPFAYDLNNAAKQRIALLGQALAASPPADLAGFRDLVLRYAGLTAGARA
jgi:aminoglycoside phosphotransferase (APT) family kinase protein